MTDVSPKKDRKRSSFGLIATTAFVVLLAVVLAILGQNTDQVDMGFLGWSVAFPLSVGLLVAISGKITKLEKNE
jgi:uncharacterized integral membrane protein